MPDWAFTTIGSILAAIAVATLLWAIFGDRARGRPRCPKCWYNLAGQVAAKPAPPWTCPECGRAVTTARATRRTHRRWGFASLALMLLIGGYLTGHAPSIYRRGWWAAAPRPLLLAWMLTKPTTFLGQPSPANQSPWFREFIVRYKHKPITTWWPGEPWLAAHILNTFVHDDSVEAKYHRHMLAQILLQSRAARRNSLDTFDADVRGYVLFTKVTQAYATANSYRDEAVIVETRDLNAQASVMISRTAFRRADGALRHDSYIDSSNPDTRAYTFVTWGQSPQWTSLLGSGSTRTHQDWLSSLSMNGSSFGPAGMLGSMYFANEAPDAAIVGEELFDGHRCYRLRTHANINAWMLIDIETLAIRQWRDRMGRLMTFRPELNPALADDMFTFDPATSPPGIAGYVESIVAALRPAIEGSGDVYRTALAAVEAKRTRPYVFEGLQTRKAWPAGSPILVYPRLRTAWARDQHAMTIMRWSTRDGSAHGEATLGGPERWNGITTPLRGEVTLDIELDIYRVTSGSTDTPELMGRERASTSFRIVEEIAEAIKPVHSARLDWILAQLLTIDVDGVPLLNYEGLYSLEKLGFDGVAFGVRVELLHNGVVVADSREGWIIGDRLSHRYSPNGASIPKSESAKYIQLHSREPGWIARIRSDVTESLGVFEGEHYWQGQIDLPYTLLQGTRRGAIVIKPLPPGGPPMDWVPPKPAP